MKKLIISLLAILFAGSLFAAPAKPYEYFTVDPAAASIEAGTLLTIKGKVKTQDSFMYNGVTAFVQRRMAPASYFASQSSKVKFYHKNPAKPAPYDSIALNKNILKKAVAEGEFELTVNTAGMTPGDYAVALQGYFTKPGAKAAYASIYFVLNIKEAKAAK